MDDLRHTSHPKNKNKRGINFFNCPNLIWLHQTLKCLPVLEPSSIIVILWEIFHVITILIIFFWLPFNLSFGIS